MAHPHAATRPSHSARRPFVRRSLGFLTACTLAAAPLYAAPSGKIARKVLPLDEEFRVCIWGDTQGMVRDWVWNHMEGRQAYESQVRYALAGNCGVVLHMGDLVDLFVDRTPEEVAALAAEWERTSAALGPLLHPTAQSRIVPFSPSRGNHDLVEWYTRFIEKHVEHQPYVHAVSRSKLSSAIVAEIGGQEQLILSLSCGSPQPEVAFIRQQIAEHPGMPTILHSHDAASPNLRFRGGCGNRNSRADGLLAFVRATPQIYLVAGGHWIGERAAIDQPTAVTDHPILVVLENHQGPRGIPAGGDGWMALLTVSRRTGIGRLDHYTEHHQIWSLEDGAARGEFDLKFGDRFGSSSNGVVAKHERPARVTAGYYGVPAGPAGAQAPSCNSAYFVNDGLSGIDSCHPKDGHRELLRLGAGTQATAVPSRLPIGSARRSSALLSSPRIESARLRPGPGASWLNLDPGFVCVWIMPLAASEQGSTWITNRSESGSAGFRIDTLSGADAGRVRVTIGGTSLTASSDSARLRQDRATHICLGYEPAPGSGAIQLSIDGRDACPTGGCPTDRTGSFLSSGPLLIGDPTAPAAYTMHELLFVQSSKLTPARARWITACGAGDGADSRARKETYLGGELGSVEGPGGEASCSR